MNKYDDIIILPHYISDKHPKMSMHDRAAQFSPFAALTGHGDAIKETARLTDEKLELSEDEIFDVNTKLNNLVENAHKHQEIALECFVPDERKCGGAYVTITGTFKRVDDYAGTIVLTNGIAVKISDVFKIRTI